MGKTDKELTNKAFWDKMERKYPKAVAYLNEWIDAYKKENGWSTLFTCEFEGDRGPEYLPQYQELPVAMQFGIFIQFVLALDQPSLDNGIQIEMTRDKSIIYEVQTLMSIALAQLEKLLLLETN